MKLVDKLQEKLKLFKEQRLWNGIMLIIAILILLFVPLVTFKNLRFEFSLEWIIAFIVLIVGIVRAIILNSKIEELEIDCGDKSNKHEDIKETETKEKDLEFICNYCNMKFISQKLLTKHYLTCSKKQKVEEDETISFWIWGVYGCLVVLFFILTLIFIFKGMVSIFRTFILISIIVGIGFVLYMEFYLKKKIIDWVRKTQL